MPDDVRGRAGRRCNQPCDPPAHQEGSSRTRRGRSWRPTSSDQKSRKPYAAVNAEDRARVGTRTTRSRSESRALEGVTHNDRPVATRLRADSDSLLSSGTFGFSRKAPSASHWLRAYRIATPIGDFGECLGRSLSSQACIAVRMAALRVLRSSRCYRHEHRHRRRRAALAPPMAWGTPAACRAFAKWTAASVASTGLEPLHR
jgi:hypothetical protein